MLFTRLYATGTRTVRGLEALALSLPPTPGHSVVKRPNNENLHTIGEVFADKGYEPIYLYGGYGYFDNMEHFFGSNGYTFIDRSAIADKADIHYENIWGVADEDLFTLTLRELDKRHAAGRPFFAHVMTTSNHRPFTYPAGRVDIAAGHRRRRRGQVHRLGARRLHRARAGQAVVRRHRVRHRRRPLRGGPRQDGPAARPLPHSDADLRAEAHPACADRDHRVADRRAADDPEPCSTSATCRASSGRTS